MTKNLSQSFLHPKNPHRKNIANWCKQNADRTHAEPAPGGRGRSETVFTDPRFPDGRLPRPIGVIRGHQSHEDTEDI